MEIMKSVWGNIKNIIIVILVGWLVFEKQCSEPCPDPLPCPTFDTANFIASLPVQLPDTFYKPEPYIVYRDTGSTIFVPEDVDSLAIVMAYFTPSIYLDEFEIDSTISFKIRDSINENKIQRRDILDLIVYPRYTVVTKTVTEPYKPRNKWLLGLGLGRSVDQFGMTANLMLLNKKDNAYQLSYDVINQDLYFTMFWKIGKKR